MTDERSTSPISSSDTIPAEPRKGAESAPSPAPSEHFARAREFDRFFVDGAPSPSDRLVWEWIGPKVGYDRQRFAVGESPENAMRIADALNDRDGFERVLTNNAGDPNLEAAANFSRSVDGGRATPSAVILHLVNVCDGNEPNLRDGEARFSEAQAGASLGEAITKSLEALRDKGRTLGTLGGDKIIEAVDQIQASLAVELDPPICRLQFPDGTVPGNAREAAEGWHVAYGKARELALGLQANLTEAVNERDELALEVQRLDSRVAGLVGDISRWQGRSAAANEELHDLKRWAAERGRVEREPDQLEIAIMNLLGHDRVCGGRVMGATVQAIATLLREAQAGNGSPGFVGTCQPPPQGKAAPGWTVEQPMSHPVDGGGLAFDPSQPPIKLTIVADTSQEAIEQFDNCCRTMGWVATERPAPGRDPATVAACIEIVRRHSGSEYPWPTNRRALAAKMTEHMGGDPKLGRYRFYDGPTAVTVERATESMEPVADLGPGPRGDVREVEPTNLGIDLNDLASFIRKTVEVVLAEADRLRDRSRL